MANIHAPKYPSWLPMPIGVMPCFFNAAQSARNCVQVVGPTLGLRPALAKSALFHTRGTPMR